MTPKERRFRIVFYAVWVVLIVLQAIFTEITPDEAYYWVYSQHLSLGYFDHPPMIAFMIKAGYFLFHNEFGTRLLSLITGFIGLLIIEKIIEVKNFYLFAALISSVEIAQLGGFFAVPDSPYFFFIAVFMYVYKKYLVSNSYREALLLGVVGACILYSKYHGAMLFFFLLLSNFSVLKRKTFYAAVVILVVCFLPHLVWLIQHDFPSFRYHFGDRNAAGYEWQDTFVYLLGQLFIYGPIASVFVFIALVAYKAKNSFQLSMKFTAIGVLVFLFLFSFIGTVEANWSLAVLIPLLIIAYHYLSEKKLARKIFYFTVPVSVVLILMARGFLVYDYLDGYIRFGNFHYKREWTTAIHSRAGDLPVVFCNSYQDASVYAFYTGEVSTSLNMARGRMNQYSLLSIEDSLQDKKVMLVTNWGHSAPDSVPIHDAYRWYVIVDHFSSYSKVYFDNDQTVLHVSDSGKLHMQVNVTSRFTDQVIFADSATMPSFITYQYYSGKKIIHEGNTGIPMRPELMGRTIDLELTVPPEKGTYMMRISVTTGWLAPTFNSKKWKVIVQ